MMSFNSNLFRILPPPTYPVPRLSPEMPLLPYLPPKKVYDKTFICTNEKGQEKILLALENLGNDIARKAESIQGRVNVEHIGYVGCSGLLNLNLVAACGGSRKIDYITIFDINPKLQVFWEQIKDFICTLNPDHFPEAQKNFCDFIEAKQSFPTFLSLSFEIAKGYSFLSTQEKFRKIYDIFVNNRFSFKLIDLSNYLEFESFLQMQMDQGIVPFIFYLSNIIPISIEPRWSNPLYHSTTYLNFHTTLNKITGFPQDPIVIWATASPNEMNMALSGLKHRDAIMGSFHYCVIDNNLPNEIELHLQHGVNPNMRLHKKSLLVASLRNKNCFEYIKRLIDYKADVNEKRKKWTPLHLAVDHPDPNVIHLLVEHGAQIDAQNSKLETPLHLAVKTRQWANVHAFLDLKANPNIVDNQDCSPLSIALKKSRCPIFSNQIHSILEKMIPSGRKLNKEEEEELMPDMQPSSKNSWIWV